MRAREIHGPLADDGVVEPFHELRKMLDGESPGNLAAILALDENLPEQPKRAFLALTHVWRTHRIHRTGKNHSFPQRTVGFRVTGQLLIQPAQMFSRSGLTGNLLRQVVSDAGKPSPPNL